MYLDVKIDLKFKLSKIFNNLKLIYLYIIIV